MLLVCCVSCGIYRLVFPIFFFREIIFFLACMTSIATTKSLQFSILSSASLISRIIVSQTSLYACCFSVLHIVPSSLNESTP